MKRIILAISVAAAIAAGNAEDKVAGRVYPERADDVAWENELVGFRVYGPGTQKKGEKSFGYDIFFKYPGKGLVLEKLYGPETDPATWEKYDSLKRIDPKLAKEFENSISYHIDHGLGMDCYAVGPTLGAGVAAFLEDGAISFPWCYEKVEILEKGPDRFSFSLDFAPRIVGNDTITEHRIITLESNSHLNNCKVWFDGLKEAKSLVVGFPLRDNSGIYYDLGKGILAYADPTQGPDNGKALLGIVCETPAEEYLTADGHSLLRYEIHPGDSFEYKWGFAWNRTDIQRLTEWIDYLSRVW